MRQVQRHNNLFHLCFKESTYQREAAHLDKEDRTNRSVGAVALFKRRNEELGKLTALLLSPNSENSSPARSPPVSLVLVHTAYLSVAHLALVFTRENGSTWHTYCFVSAREIRCCISWTA